jgi:hypothetical protein
MAVDLHDEFRRLWGRNAGEVVSFTMNVVKTYWRLIEEEDMPSAPDRYALCDEYYTQVLSGDYEHVFNVSADFIWEHTGIRLDVDFLLDKPNSGL